MDYQKLKKNFERLNIVVSYFENREQAIGHLSSQLSGETIGIGGSITIQQIGLYDELIKNNKVLWHWKDLDDRYRFSEFEAYFCSANAVSETGEIVNIDGGGNRLAATLFGPKKVYFVVGVNKITPDLASAIDRARNIAAPKNAVRLERGTPCTIDGKCHDCSSNNRICQALLIQMGGMSFCDHTELVIINEELGY